MSPLRGYTERLSYAQRVPVPLGMWHVGDQGNGYPLMLHFPPTIRVWNRRAGILVCYEQLSFWPAIQTLAHNPDMLLAPSNVYWAANTPIQRFSMWRARLGRPLGHPTLRGKQPMRILTAVFLLGTAANLPLNGWTLPLSNCAACLPHRSALSMPSSALNPAATRTPCRSTFRGLFSSNGIYGRYIATQAPAATQREALNWLGYFERHGIFVDLGLMQVSTAEAQRRGFLSSRYWTLLQSSRRLADSR